MRTSPSNKKQSPGNRHKKKALSTYMQEKLAITILVITLALFALIYQLYDIVRSNQDHYNQLVLNQQNYDSRVIPYRRGNIVDRKGTVLASTDKVYNLILDPKQIMSAPDEYLEPTIAALSAQFGYGLSELRALITENASRSYIRYARRLPPDQKEAFEKLKDGTNGANRENGNPARVYGVWFEEEYKRIYPYNSLACNVVGFVTSDGGTGNSGIEQFYNSDLSGNNGREYGYLNDDSNLERVIKPPANGYTIVSTIDANIQNIVEKYINEWDTGIGSERIGVVVMDPRNGEILAMASGQQFDLNNPWEVSDRFTDEELKAFGEQEAMETWNRLNPEDKIGLTQVDGHYSAEEILSLGKQVAWNKVWRNFAVNDTYEPGSPSKIFTVAAGLEEGVLSGNETFVCDGFQDVGGHHIKCVNRFGHGTLTLQETLMLSCNDALMQIAAQEGRERFDKYQRLFGFGSKTGIDLPGEADTSKLVYTAETMKSSDLATNSFGQNYNCTMVQMAAAYASVINGGSYYAPHVVKRVEDEYGAVIKKTEPVLVRETVSESTSNYIKQTLLRTVTEGTGKAAAVAGYDIAGKTGTAEKLPRQLKNYLVSFCGFAPAATPEVLIYVVIDTPHTEDQAHAVYATEVFQKCMSDILPYLNIFPNVDVDTVPDEVIAQLPQEEGISEGSNAVTETEVPKAYETDEYVEPEGQGDSGIPGDVPGAPSVGGDGGTPESQETAPSSGLSPDGATAGTVTVGNVGEGGGNNGCRITKA